MRKTWTDGLIVSELMAFVNGSGQMPSNSELASMGKLDLANAITRNGGYVSWAKRLGLKRRKSDSDTGWDGEIALARQLTDKGFLVKREIAIKSPHDLLIDSVVRVDVKSAKYAEYGVCKGWFYRIGKTPQADIVALYQLDTEDCFFIPWMDCPTTNITISRDGGKYKSYRNNYGQLTSLAEHRKLEKRIWCPY